MCLCFAPLLSFAQSKNDTISFNYTGVEAVDSVPARILYSRAKLFAAENFKSAKDVIQMDDSEAGLLLMKGNIIPVIKGALIGNFEAGFVHFTMKVQVKDGKYKYTLSDFEHENFGNYRSNGGSLTNRKPACGTFYLTKNYWHQIKEQTDMHAQALIDALKSRMVSQEISKKDDF